MNQKVFDKILAYFDANNIKYKYKIVVEWQTGPNEFEQISFGEATNRIKHGIFPFGKTAKQ